MTDTEELIVAALRTQADRRPDGVAVRAALARTGSRSRGMRVLVVAAVAVAVAAIAITVPFVLHRDQHPVAPVATTPPPNQPPFWQQAMAYEPGWLPDGVVETDRAGAKNVVRGWGVPSTTDWPGPAVQLSVFAESRVTKTGDVIDVNGVPAYVDTNKDYTDVDWLPKPGIHLQVRVQGGLQHRDIAIHVAKALRSNGTEQFRALVELGWCPFHDGDEVTTGGFAPGAATGTAMCTRDKAPVADVQLSVSTQHDVTSGSPVTVRGRQGLYVGANAKRAQEVSVALGDGRYLTVLAGSGDRPGYEPVTKADLIRVADTAVIHDAAYLTWYGRS